MKNRVWAALGAIAILGASAAVGVYVASPGGEEEAPPAVQETATATPPEATLPVGTAVPTPTLPALTPGPGVTLWRWANVSVLIPDDAEISVGRTTFGAVAHPPAGGPVLIMLRDGSGITIDALDGRIISSVIRDADHPDFDEISNTIQVTPPPDLSSLPWPYDEEIPTHEKSQQGNTRYWEPDPSTGFAVRFLIREFEGGGDEVLALENFRSRRFVDVSTGTVIGTNDRIAPEDAQAIDRWTDAIEVVAQ